MPAIVGVISDTHGLLRPEAVAALRGSTLIIHAGDIGRPEILAELRRIAPVIAVRGNVDRGEWAMTLPERETVRIAGCTVHVLHDVKTLDIDPAKAGHAAVISGHSHCPTVEEKNGILYVNPGSAGPRRFKLPVAAARIEIRNGLLRAEILQLPIGQEPKRRTSRTESAPAGEHS